jgi:hypothetical protein
MVDVLAGPADIPTNTTTKLIIPFIAKFIMPFIARTSS